MRMPKKKKLTKAQLEELARQEEVERRRQEEERIRLEEEERQRLAELERQRLERVDDQKRLEAQRLEEERSELGSYLERLHSKRQHAARQRVEEEDWAHCLECSHLPLASSRAQLNDYRNFIRENVGSTMAELLGQVSDLEHVIVHGEHESDMRVQEGDAAAVEELRGFLADMRALAEERADAAAAAVLLRHEELTPMDEESRVVQVERVVDGVKFALWINQEKNQRPPKHIVWPGVDISIEIHRRIGSQVHAMKVVQLRSDHHAGASRDQFAALGGTIHLELVAIPAQAKRLETPSGTWALRQQPSTVPLTQSVHYPTIQDPTDPSKSVYPAIVVSCLLDKGLNAGPSPAAGVWDDEAQCWSQQGVEGVSYDPSTGRLEFTAHSLGCMALLQDRTAMVPYKAWSVRPIDGRGGRRAALTLYLEALERPVQFGIGEGRVWLLDSPTEAMDDLVGKEMQPWGLLREMSARGYYLLPDDNLAGFLEPGKISLKKEDLELRFCNELGMLCGAFLLGSSRHNRAADGEHLVARVSEIVDWEGMGRTELDQTERIFSKEKMDRPTRPLAVMQRGEAGVCFVDGRDRAEGLVMPPPYGSFEYYDSVYGEVHASLLKLLDGTKTPRLLEAADAATADLAKTLRASPEAVELAMGTSALLSQTVAQLMHALRLFSFG